MAITLCSQSDVIYKAGVGASSTITASSALLDSLINEAEGVIIGETRRDWVADYASVNTYVKELLRQCVASLAAKNVVNYDTSGFYSRQIAETTLNVLHDMFSQTLKALKDLDTTKIRSAV